MSRIITFPITNMTRGAQSCGRHQPAIGQCANGLSTEQFFDALDFARGMVDIERRRVVDTELLGLALIELLTLSPAAKPILEDLGLTWRRALKYMRSAERGIRRGELKGIFPISQKYVAPQRRAAALTNKELT